MVMSDHGFHSFRREVNLNTWLLQNGYLVFTGRAARRTCRTSSAAAGSGRASTGADEAYALGLGQIYFNLRGREAQGIVSAGGVQGAAGGDPGEAHDVTDPETGSGCSGRLPARRHLQGRVPPDGARPPGRLQRRLPRGLAGHPGHHPPGGGREQQPEVERRPLRDRHRDQRRRLLLQPEDRTPRRTSWTSPPRS